MATHIGGNVSEYIVFVRNCSMDGMLLTDVELVAQRSNRLDTVLYKTYILHAQIV